jgi:Zn-dependent peptidase ImmA (M78 family)
VIRPEDIQSPQVSFAEIWVMADEFRAQQGDRGAIPVQIEEIIDLNLGITIQPKRNLKATAGTDALLLNLDPPVIVVDYDDYHDEECWPILHFSMAHELGHYLIHKKRFDVYKGVYFAGLEGWVDFLSKVPADVHLLLEQQANQFAGRLMVPVDELASRFNAAIYKRGLRVPVSEEDLELVSTNIGKKFGVSGKCISVRIDREKLNSGEEA